jgi:manganese/zinc/iron transport system permease protein
MNWVEFEIQLIAAVVALACALPGTFLVLRRMALMSDAISHSVLLGIVLAFFLTHDLASPLLIVAASLTGVLTVVLVEALRRTRLVRADAAIALVFPALFSIAVVLIARYARSVHLDTDVVLLGELAFAPFRRLEIAGYDAGPRVLYLMGGILALNCAFLGAFYKELKLSTFDPALAAALGFSPMLLHYAFMALVSVTVVGAFEAVGSILVVALMIAPPAAAWLLTERLPRMLLLSGGFAVAAAVGGFWIAWLLDASIAGAMATTAGGLFAGALLLAPGRGLLARARRRSAQRVDFARTMLVIHLLNHEESHEAEVENREEHLHEHLRWDPDFIRRVVRSAEREGLLSRSERDLLRLTPAGRDRAAAAMEFAAV